MSFVKTYTREEIREMLTTVGITSYALGVNGVTCKPSMVAEKYYWDNLLNEEERQESILKLENQEE